MFSDPFHDTFHKCFRKPCLRHKPVSLGCIAAAQDPSSQFRIPGYQDHRCSHQLHPTVRHGGMRIHDASRYLDQFSQMSHKKKLLYPEFRCHVDRLSDVVGTFDCIVQVITIVFPHEVHAVVAGSDHHPRMSLGYPLPKLHPYGVLDRLCTHGFHDPAGSQNGNASCDTELRIEGLLRQLLSPGYGNDHG